MCAAGGLSGGWRLRGQWKYGKPAPYKTEGPENADSGPLKRLMLRACQATGNAPLKYKHTTAYRRAILRVAFFFFLGLPSPGFR